ncbi:DinB family protein [Nocardioides sp. 503]|uniref:DinB family protein n=1 Tax=Nocardioides sp. 503 TaxID=2508326 RepID=UPI00106F5C60|nr:DinB family protein [Nocardioides sp. 503]
MTYPEPPLNGSEADTLVGSLERQRATFAWKCADLDHAGLRATVGSSTVSLGGLLKHLARMEDLNFTHVLAGRPLPPPWRDVDPDDEEGWERTSATDDDPEDLRQLWEGALARSRDAVTEALAEGGPGHLFRMPSGTEVSLRRLLVDMVEEYARHTGHADLIRESVDGRVGEDPPGGSHPYTS